MDRFQKQTGSEQRAWWRRFVLLDRGKETFDHSVDRFLRQDFGDVEILLMPRDIATADPSLLHEFAQGQFGLDGILVSHDDSPGSIFDAPHVDASFLRVLNGFAWLRDLADAGGEEAAAAARGVVREWIKRHSRIEGIAYEPAVVARRVVSLLAHAQLIASGLDKKQHSQFVRTLAGQVAVLRSQLGQTDDGPERLFALIALAMAGLCLSRHTDLLAEVTPLLERELARQVLPDGGHVSRNGEVLLHLLFDLMPLKKCYTARTGRVPDGLAGALDRMLPMIRFLRMGDSSLARFNGVSATPTDALATLFANDEKKREAAAAAPDSRYARLEAGPAIVLSDIGSPPPGAASRSAHSGCLSFELSVRHFALVVNAGAYQGEDEDWRRYARATSAHSTLAIDDFSQGEFEVSGDLVGPHEVGSSSSGASVIEAAHAGYAGRFALLHERRLDLSSDGLRLDGRDRLRATGPARHAVSPPYAIRFHLHPFIDLAPVDAANWLLTLPDGEVWRFHAEGAQLQAADGLYLAYRRGPQATHVLVLTGAARDGTEVRWRFEQFRPRPAT